MNAEIWLLVDNRAGTKVQALALAEAMKLGYEIKNINYNIFARLPNILLMLHPIHIKREFFASLNLTRLPKIIISAGRRTAPLALYLKKKSANKLHVIQIMRPDCYYAKFDFIVIPQHDNIRQESANIIRIIGSLNNVKAKIATDSKELYNHYPEIKQFIAVMVGGNSKNYQFNNNDAILLSSLLAKISRDHSLPLFISFSRRTSWQVKEIIRANFTLPNIVYDPEEGQFNPYYAMLGCADYIISTADSISMCSEVASSGKPLYIFLPDNFQSQKHRAFIEQLINLGIARKFDSSIKRLEDYSYKPLDEVEKISAMIKSTIC